MTKISVSEAAKAVVRRNTEKCKAEGISRRSRNCLPTIFSTILRSRDARRTRLARASFTRFCALPSGTSTRTSTGSLPMGTG